ncbi:GlxA family transcriptional regulator [Pseudomonas sp. 51_B]|uniref:GlxA family transcriptional regulator n=1 Tax=Pseudomonas sp. 51_B TaxID=2813573 RepID=UPI001A9EAA66|nr:GlxA family transcriptional regulator [Pseudomonas sp. 51_B]
MAVDISRREPCTITVLLLEQFAMIALASTIEPLREANWIVGGHAYDIKVVSHDGNAVTSSNGMSINVDGGIADVSASSMVIVCSSWDPHLYMTPAILAWLRKLARQGSRVGAVETGTYVLASAGLLDGHRATIHWENLEGFTESFPRVKISNGIFEVDRTRFSAAGASAALDMMLYMIEETHGPAIATAVADGFVYRRTRQASSPQRSGPQERLNLRQPRLTRILEFLSQNLDRHLDVAEMALVEQISDREVRRLFSVHLNSTPQAYHRRLRLEKARALLKQTMMSVTDISVCCGFSSSSDFSRAFKREYGVQPVGDRGATYHSDWSGSSRT